jgi:hypothetical protein
LPLVVDTHNDWLDRKSKWMGVNGRLDGGTDSTFESLMRAKLVALVPGCSLPECPMAFWWGMTHRILVWE